MGVQNQNLGRDDRKNHFLFLKKKFGHGIFIKGSNVRKGVDIRFQKVHLSPPVRGFVQEVSRIQLLFNNIITSMNNKIEFM